ncbi:NrdH-redoxin [Candidatus Berkelbacteria bacterium CG10_big_fil_rev_8_21_14_0_10_43_13]|uniref:NrdH-redoxin n=1 Tax=Candidatus Berkelbacteria bacterium CG10_big_fil_rev_8_21_14_0_10_43_13 TaxID=1974514 RepID=A0A2H0W6M8_9BACT|nr:MAG: NrdH-redoxin [Candidatus Berkelbacteria bacterium CG10_big_fil_rev_8_21_14_0_10_43_13]
MSEKKVTVFSTPTCPYCVMVKDYLKDKKIEFKDVNVASDQEMAMKMFNRSHNMGVPQIWINDDVVIGFDPNTIDDLLKAKQK